MHRLDNITILQRSCGLEVLINLQVSHTQRSLTSSLLDFKAHAMFFFLWLNLRVLFCEMGMISAFRIYEDGMGW